jgi:MFS family permease
MLPVQLRLYVSVKPDQRSDIQVERPWSPLYWPSFRALWFATLISNTGGWMQDVGASWLMTSLTGSATLIALVQAAESLPMFFLAVPAGALADIVDRRLLMLAGNLISLAAVVALSFCTHSGWTSPALLLVLTFAVGVGEALEGPASQAVVAELVPRSELARAVALNSAGYNLARAVGPALGGWLLAKSGATTDFLVNSLTFFVVLIVLFRWREAPKRSVLPAERFSGAMRAGLRYVAHAPELQAVLVRSGAFVLSASALWALLPVLVRELGHGPSAYGAMLSALGAGAVAGASLLNFAIITTIMLAGGVAWIVVISSLNVAARMVVPAWVQARSLAVYLLVFQGGMAVGSLGWGALADIRGARWALAGASAGLLLSLILATRYSFQEGVVLDLSPAGKWPLPEISSKISSENSLVLVAVQYVIDRERVKEFVFEMQQMETIRRRDGALQWGLFTNPDEPGKYLEEFLVESWLEHQRQHERFTVSDQQVQQRILAMHKGPAAPHVSHYLAVER